jgi:hypothetical protein
LFFFFFLFILGQGPLKMSKLLQLLRKLAIVPVSK